MSASLTGQLATLEVFEGLTADQLAWLAEHGTVVELAAGDTLFREGDAADALFVVLQGALELLFPLGGQFVPAWTQHTGAVSGLLPFSRMQHYTARGRAVGVLRILRIERSEFPAMLQAIPELGQRMVSLMADRVREVTRVDQQREKMSALGRLAAGLAHELNNPAGAVRRDAESLRARLIALGPLAADLCEAGLDTDAICALAAQAEALSERPAAALDAITRSRCEDAMSDWLDRRGVADAWRLAPTLADAGLGSEDLERLAGSLPPAAIPVVMTWIEGLIGAMRLARDIESASARISELVKSVKTYTHMDRGGDRTLVNVREGLDSTLVMLGHKLKKKSLKLERRYGDALPPVDGYAGELNQVWTNLIDNAIDAAPDGGTIVVEAIAEGSAVEVRIIDNGPGIPEALQTRIFEPFFTTKPVGSGTGLGLDIVHRVIVDQHAGFIEVESAPGRTVFIVRLPRVAVA